MTIPETDRVPRRPVWERALRRLEGFPLDPPTEEEKADAIKILRDAPTWERLDLIMERAASKFGVRGVVGLMGINGRLTPLLEEAERIHHECSL